MIAKYPDRHTKIVKRWGSKLALLTRTTGQESQPFSEKTVDSELFSTIQLCRHLAELSVHLRAKAERDQM